MMYPKRKEIISWSLYDFANSAYASLVPVLLFPLYYKAIILSNSPKADLWWGITIGVSILLSGLLSAPLGAYADLTNRRKLLFVATTLLAILGTALLAFSASLTPIMATAVFILTNMVFNIAITLYDSLLYNVSSRQTTGKISGFGWATGYVGGLLCTLIVYPFIKAGVDSRFYWVAFIIVAVFYFLFSIPAFITVRDIEKTTLKEKRQIKNVKNAFTVSLKTVWGTLRDWKKYRHLLLFLSAFYFLTEGLTTLMFFFSLYATTTLQVPMAKLVLLLILVQVVAIPATIISGKYSDAVGHKRMIIWMLLGWCLATILLLFVTGIQMLYVLAVLFGLVVGGSQAIARAWYTNLIPPQKRSELFGFNSFASKISTTIGPPLFGLISTVTGNQRLAVLSILVYFVASLLLFVRIKDNKEL